MMATRKSRTSFMAHRLANFLKLFLRNTRGFIGLCLILFFCFLAVGAQLLTPYNQLGTYFDRQEPLSGDMAAPGWVRVLPAALGGQPDLSENMFLINDTSFSKENWQWPAGEWNVALPNATLATDTHTTFDNATFDVSRDATGGYPPNATDPNAPNGNLLFAFNRNGSEPLNTNVSSVIYKEFDYPYTGPPKFGNVRFSLLLNGTFHTEERPQWSKNESQNKLVNMSVLDVPVKFMFFVANSSGYRFKVWPVNSSLSTVFNVATGYAKNFSVWDDVSGLVETRYIPGKDTYSLGVEIILSDAYVNSTRDVELDVRIDNVRFTLYGTCWGILGTNMNGYDIWSELVYGTRVSLYVGVVAAVLSVVIGLIVGLASGYLGRLADEIMMRISDVLLVLPSLPLLIVLFAVLGASIENLIILMGLLGWMGFAKVVRSQVLSLRERTYIEAAKAAGAGTGHILIKHVMPNVMGLVYVTLATSVPGAIVAEAALAWLGFFDPSRMSWGRMLEEMQAANAADKWWWVLPPGLCIAAISIAFVLLGYALDEVLNPKLRQRR